MATIWRGLSLLLRRNPSHTALRREPSAPIVAGAPRNNGESLRWPHLRREPSALLLRREPLAVTKTGLNGGSRQVSFNFRAFAIRNIQNVLSEMPMSLERQSVQDRRRPRRQRGLRRWDRTLPSEPEHTPASTSRTQQHLTSRPLSQNKFSQLLAPASIPLGPFLRTRSLCLSPFTHVPNSLRQPAPSLLAQYQSSSPHFSLHCFLASRPRYDSP